MSKSHVKQKDMQKAKHARHNVLKMRKNRQACYTHARCWVIGMLGGQAQPATMVAGKAGSNPKCLFTWGQEGEQGGQGTIVNGGGGGKGWGWGMAHTYLSGGRKGVAYTITNRRTGEQEHHHHGRAGEGAKREGGGW